MNAPPADPADENGVTSFGTDAYDATRKNRGKPHGPHVSRVPSAPIAESASHADLNSRIAEALNRIAEREEAMQVQKPRFDWSWNVGNLLVIVTIVVSVVVSAATGIVYLTRYQDSTNDKFSQLITRIDRLQESQDQDRKDIQEDRRATTERVQLYAPQILDAKATNNLQAQDIAGIREGTRTLQGMVADLLKAVTTMHEDQAVLKLRIDMMGGKAPGPHGELPPPNKMGAN